MKKPNILQNAALVKFLIVLFSMVVSHLLTNYILKSDNIWTMIVIASVLAAVLEVIYIKITGNKN